MRIVIKNRAHGRKGRKIQAYWSVFEGEERRTPWNKMPYEDKGEAFKRLVRRLEWRPVGYRQIALMAEINRDLYVILKGIQGDSDFDDVWEQVEDMEFEDFYRRLYTYYASMMLD